MHIKFSDFSRVTSIRKHISASGKLELGIAGCDRKFRRISGFVSLVQVPLVLQLIQNNSYMRVGKFCRNGTFPD